MNKNSNNDKLNLFIKNYDSSYRHTNPLVHLRPYLITLGARRCVLLSTSLIFLPLPYVSKHRKKKLREIIGYKKVKWLES